MRFFSMNSMIPWSFVVSVALRLRQNAELGFTGLHRTVFEHQAQGLVIYVTLVAGGV